MTLVPRLIAPVLRRLASQYPVVTLTGPRQSGKTTLCRTVFPDLGYANLEFPDVRAFAIEDPRGFLAQYDAGVVLDEIQRAPDLPSYIQGIVDEGDRPGQFVLTGSQQLEISQTVSQSLAGRTALLRLLPFSIAEAATIRPGMGISEMLHTGFLPRIYRDRLDPTESLGNYFETYVERDLRQLTQVRQLREFATFVRLCAGRTGQLVNASVLGADAGVSHTTARAWISLLQASYIVFLLPPLLANVRKRLVRSPKLYFYDVGLAAYLLGIRQTDQVWTHPLRGALFENLVVAEALKHRFHNGRDANLAFYRDRTGNEVDLIYELGERLVAIEIKSGSTIASDALRGLHRLQGLLPDRVAKSILVHGGDAEHLRSDVQVTSARRLVDHLAAADSAA